METRRRALTRTGQAQAVRLERSQAQGPGHGGAKALAQVRCQGCGAWVAGTRAIRWEMCDPVTERETTLWLCGLECPWLFRW